jgi:hypothetical protein
MHTILNLQQLTQPKHTAFTNIRLSIHPPHIAKKDTINRYIFKINDNKRKLQVLG